MAWACANGREIEMDHVLNVMWGCSSATGAAQEGQGPERTRVQCTPCAGLLCERFEGDAKGPSEANASTVSTTAEKTVGVIADAGATGTVLRIAPQVQQNAQALHSCWSPERPFQTPQNRTMQGYPRRPGLQRLDVHARFRCGSHAELVAPISRYDARGADRCEGCARRDRPAGRARYSPWPGCR